MNLVHPDATLVNLLKLIATPTLRYRIFVRNVTIDRATVLADFGIGFERGPIDVNVADFTLSGVASHKGTIIAPPVAIVDTSGIPETLYGYYVTDVAGTMLLACAKFDTPIVAPGNESTTIVPILGDSSAYSS